MNPKVCNPCTLLHSQKVICNFFMIAMWSFFRHFHSLLSFCSAIFLCQAFIQKFSFSYFSSLFLITYEPKPLSKHTHIHFCMLQPLLCVLYMMSSRRRAGSEHLGMKKAFRVNARNLKLLYGVQGSLQMCHWIFLVGKFYE